MCTSSRRAPGGDRSRSGPAAPTSRVDVGGGGVELGGQAGRRAGGRLVWKRAAWADGVEGVVVVAVVAGRWRQPLSSHWPAAAAGLPVLHPIPIPKRINTYAATDLCCCSRMAHTTPHHAAASGPCASQPPTANLQVVLPRGGAQGGGGEVRAPHPRHAALRAPVRRPQGLQVPRQGGGGVPRAFFRVLGFAAG